MGRGGVVICSLCISIISMNFSNFFFLEGREIGSYAIENIFFAPLNNDKPKIPREFLGAFLRAWSAGHESSAKDADQLLRLSTWLTDYALRIAPKNAQGISQFLTLLFSLHFFWTML